MQFEHLVVIGASAGGVDAIASVAAGLPPDFGAPICLVVHTGADSPGMLHRVLHHAGPLPADVVRESEPLRPGRFYVAPPDRHILVEPGIVIATRGPKENNARPAIDPLFRSAAQVYGPRVIGVVLTGNLDDGTAGLRTIKQLGGLAIVQDPDAAESPSMPASALRRVSVDYCVPLPDIGPLLTRLTRESVHDRPVPESKLVAAEVGIAKGENSLHAGIEAIGRPSPFACPECHGVLREISDGDEPRYRCHTGHAYTKAAFLSENTETVEAALWSAIRALEERIRMLRSDGDGPWHGDIGERSADRALRDAAILRKLVTRPRPDR
jgi:two-component system chemotaxis response regulator CheB